MPEVKFTNEWINEGVRILMYSDTGLGKTSLIKTCPRPLILNVSTEKGLLSLRGEKIPYITVSSLEELTEVCFWLKESDSWDKFDTLCIDSITELAEVCLANYKKVFKDDRKAFLSMADDVMEQIRTLISIPGKDLYCICKQDLVQDNEGRILFSPSVPGKAFKNNFPYYFDEIFTIRVFVDADGQKVRIIQTQPDERYKAKDRSNSLDPYEEMDLTKIIKKIKGEKS